MNMLPPDRALNKNNLNNAGLAVSLGLDNSPSDFYEVREDA
jgi:hypothetical protein